MPARTIRLRIPIRRSRNPQLHNAYAVGHGAAWLLKAGWVMVHQGHSDKATAEFLRGFGLQVSD